jgi:hypothetical protein
VYLVFAIEIGKLNAVPTNGVQRLAARQDTDGNASLRQTRRHRATNGAGTGNTNLQAGLFNHACPPKKGCASAMGRRQNNILYLNYFVAPGIRVGVIPLHYGWVPMTTSKRNREKSLKIFPLGVIS